MTPYSCTVSSINRNVVCVKVEDCYDPHMTQWLPSQVPRHLVLTKTAKKSIFEGYGEFFVAYTNSIDPDGPIDTKIRPVSQLVRAQLKKRCRSAVVAVVGSILVIRPA